MSVRLRRLQSDYEQIQARLRSSRFITVRKATGDPPEHYEVEYRIRSLVLQDDGQIVESASHVAEITLTRAYPHRAPHCKMLTPIFHPNIDPGAICIGDHWAASESLSDLIVRIGQMIAYQTYNTKSPLNGQAARWADEHRNLLPVDSADLIPPDLESAPPAAAPPPIPPPNTARCQNCGTPASEQALTHCAGGHLVCPDCTVRCAECGGTLCLLCESTACAVCGRKGCARCLKACAECGKAACAEHFARCARCGKASCSNCAGRCVACGKVFCKTHVRPCKSCGKLLCAGCAGACSICPPEFGHHKSELAECAQCNALVCRSHLHVSAVSGQKICDMCGVRCAACGNWAAHAEVVVCGECGNKVCSSCARDCRVCRKKFCPVHTASCQRCGHVACLKCMGTCPVCSKQVCRTQSHMASCSVCHRLVCRDCLKVCADCGKPTCAEHVFACATCNTHDGRADKKSSSPRAPVVCRKCIDSCAFCNKLVHAKHLAKCPLCGRLLCSSCGKVCTRCKATVCSSHVVPLSRGREFCVPCFRQHEKMTARIAVPCILGGIILLVLIVWLIFRLSG